MPNLQKSTSNQPSALIIEPNESLVSQKNPAIPYSFLAKQKLQISVVASVESALAYLVDQTPNLVFLSASFSPHKTLQLLEALKNHSTEKVIPLVMVIDLSLPTSIIPGTSWGESLGIVHTAISSKEFQATIKRFL